MHAVIEGFDAAYVLKDTMEELVGPNLLIEAYTARKTVFDFLVKQGSTRNDDCLSKFPTCASPKLAANWKT